MPRAALPTLLLAAGAASVPLPAQSRPSSELMAAAKVQLPAHPDSAVGLLRGALDAARYPADSAAVLVWLGIAHFYAGRDSLARASFHTAFTTYSGVTARNLDQVSPRLAELYESERAATIVYGIDFVDERPRLVGGPPVVYPWTVWRRGVTGRAVILATVDTAGRAEPNLEIDQIPDSGLREPVRQMILASAFTPGRRQGRPVRTLLRLVIELKPGPPPNPTELAGRARDLVRRDPDSALALTAMALDPAVPATEGARVYALLIEGIAWTAKHEDTLAAPAIDSALAGYQRLTARGVDLAPFLRRLADSVRLARRGVRQAVAAMVNLVVLGVVDERPALISHPPIRYPLELWQLKVGGTVVVEARLDAAGHVAPGTVRVIQSPNPGLNAEAVRVVAASVYRPARKAGQPVAVVIRQPITFQPY